MELTRKQICFDWKEERWVECHLHNVMIYTVILERFNKKLLQKENYVNPRSAPSIISQRKYSCVGDVGIEMTTNNNK